MYRYLRDRKSGLFFCSNGTWDCWLKGRPFENMEVLLRTARQIDQEDLEIVVTFDYYEPSESDIALPVLRGGVLERAA